ncbi:MAG: DUF1016 family protein [Bacilli bacterium]|nr:DUF1016 family protein [Bacilli bacterium]
MNYYKEIKNKLIDNEIYAKVKDYSKERHRVITYFEIGRLLTEAGSKYGEDIIQKYSDKLMIEVGKKYNKRTLFRMKQFYIIFSNEKVSPLATQLTWSHYTELLPIKDKNKMLYYVNIFIELNLSRNELRNRIKSNEYERLPLESKNKLLDKEKSKVTDLIKNPIIIKNKYNYEIISEKILKQLIIEDIESFLEELGSGFTFIKSEYSIKIGDTYNYIDLLLYNIKFKCYVVIELKITALKKEYIGQIQTYMNYIDKNIKTIEENTTVGIIIVKRNDKYIMEYCSDERILTREYVFI